MPQTDSPPWAPRPRRWRLAAWCLRGALGLVVLAGLALGLGYWRLTQGPIALPILADLAQAAVNAGTDRFQIRVGGAALALRRGGRQPALQFHDVHVTGPTGAPLMSVPRLGIAVSLADLAWGRLRPTAIVVVGAEARVTRSRAGVWRFGLGAGGLDLGADPAADAPGGDALAAVLAGLVGDAEPVPELSRLRRVSILDAAISYDYAASRRVWRTTDADLRLERTDEGARATLSVSLTDGATAGAQMLLEATRSRGTGQTRLDLGLRGLRPIHLADQLAALAWMRLIDAPMAGDLHLTVGDDGTVAVLTGSLSAGPGSLLAEGSRGEPFDQAELAFTYDPALERMRIDTGTLRSPAVTTGIDGFFDLRRGPDGAVTGLDAQLGLSALAMDLPALFAGPLAFDGGQIVGRLDLDPLRIQVVDAHLARGATGFALSGTARLDDAGWRTQVRAAGSAIGIADLVAHWPLPAAVNARTWVAEHLSTGRIDAVVAHLQMDHGAETLALDFAFADLTARYLDQMSPITGGAGQGSLTLSGLHLDVTAGRVEPVAGQPIDLAGSTVRIAGFDAPVTPTSIDIAARGPIPAILALIDQPPLGLIARLGADLGGLRGQAQVAAQIGFPLIDDLALDQVGARVTASLTDVTMPLAVGADRVLAIQADRASLTADTAAMTITGPARVEGTPVTVEWREDYGGATGGRTATVKGAITPDLLARVRLPLPQFTGGSAPATLRLAQTGDRPMTFALDADLGPARLALPDLAWAKDPGAPGTLALTGALADPVTLDAVALDAPGLQVQGSAAFGADGGLASARLSRLTRGNFVDLGLEVDPLPGGGYDVRASGPRFDLGLFEEEAPTPDAPPGPPFRVAFDIADLVLTPRFTLAPARGVATRDAAGLVTATVTGAIGTAAVAAEYTAPHNAAAALTLTAADAGGLLASAGLFAGGTGGDLVLQAQLPPDAGGDLSGVARIRDITLGQSPKLETILEAGDLDDAAAASRGDGMPFDTVVVPFQLRGDVMTLGTSVAAGPLLAVKLDGTIDQISGALDLVGVISPAYGLTGVLDNVPLLGDILSGGQGEGIFALTFTATGTLDDSRIRVNPLSLLTPGILRSIFSGRATDPDPGFLEQLERN